MKPKQLVLQRALPVAVLGLAAVSVPTLVWSSSGLPRLEKLRDQREHLEQKAARLQTEIRQLRAEVQRVKVDPAHVEQVARDELGLVRQTEIVFHFER